MKEIYKEQFMEISIDEITDIFSHQVRRTFDDDLIKDIANSIETNGFFQNIVVVENGDGTYMIVAGETRYRAAKKARTLVIPALVFPFGTDKDKLIKLSVKENTSRKSVNNFEMYSLFCSLIEEGKVLTYIEIYEYFDGSISLSQIKKIMAFQELHPSIINDTKTKKYVANLNVIVTIRKVGRKLIKKHLELSPEEVYEKYILPVYEDIKEKKIPGDRAIDMLNRLCDDEKKRDIVSSNRMRIIVDTKDLSAYQQKELETNIKDHISKLI